ncbi:MAG: efflux RND transporter permease subunit [Phycisphaerae bacterium]|nr:efflux RND transporter permease subunit [Phycisphaerae bacterium]
MGFSDLFIHRPVMTTLVMSGIVLFGVAAFRNLPMSDLPNVDFPTIQVSASLPGASPETMAAAVATPLEKQFSTIAGIDSMTSSSALGGTQITLQFNLNRDIDAAAQDVQAAIARATRQLPQDMPSPPSYQKVNPADEPILFIALTTPTLPLFELSEYAETMMAQRMSMVSGVAQVMVYGGQKYAVRVQVDPVALSSRSIGIDEVASAIQLGNVTMPTGILYGTHRSYTIQATGQLNKAEEYRPLIVAYRNGLPVRLSDVASITDSVENNKVAAWYSNQDGTSRAIILAVQRQPGTNTVQVADDVKRLLPSFKDLLPASVSVDIMYDRSTAIRDSVRDVEYTLLLTLVLVVLVIFLYLRNVSATVIPSLALPMAVIGTFVVMFLCRYNLDNLSLMALTLSVGFVVDDAIVMLENIVRHMEMGKPPLRAALDGSREIGFTIVSMTLSLAAVFIPILFMGGLIGRLFREFSVTIGAAVLVSGFIAMTLTPMLCSRFLRNPETVRHGWLYNATEAFHRRTLKFYEITLRWVLAHKFGSLLIAVAMLAGTVVLFARIPKGFLPGEDRGYLRGSTEAVEGISYKSMFEHQQAVAEILRSKPEVEAFMSSAGARGTSGGNTGMFSIRLSPKHAREHSADELVDLWRPSLNSIPGIRVSLVNPPTIAIGGRMSRGQYQFTLQSPDTKILYEFGEQMEQRIRELPGVQDVSSDLRMKNPQLNVLIRRDKASAAGITATQIESALSNAYGSRLVSTILAPNNQYYVILELKDEDQLDPSALGKLYIRSDRGRLVPLSAIADLSTGVGPLTINHQGQLPSVTISFNLSRGVSLGEAMTMVNQLARQILPDTVSTSYQGTAQAFQSSMKGLGLLLALAILVIYLVLGILYESFIHPITILSALPFAGFGALLTLMLFKIELSIYAFVGIIMLVGLVKKNGIMMVDFALEAQRKEGKNAHDAILEASLIRFRPIMMTTMAALMGALPIALGIGAGAESRQPLGLAVVGGLLFSQTLTLFVTPVFFLYMETLHKAVLGRKRQNGPSA